MRYLHKWLLRGLLKLLYRIDIRGLEHYAAVGDRVLIIANHTSLLDGVLLYAFLPDRLTFAINTRIAQRPLFKPFLRFVDLFPLDPPNPLSIKSLIKYVREGNKAVIFPEGRVTVTGSLMKIYEGPGLVADKAQAMVLPIGIDGPQFSPFSYLRGRFRIQWFPKIVVRILPPVRITVPEHLQGRARRKAAARQMQDLLYRQYFSTFDYRTTLFTALLRAARRHGMGRLIAEDIQRSPLTYRQIISRAFMLGGMLAKDTGPREHVGLLLPNSLGMLIAFLALQYLGRVPAMLNFTAGAQGVLNACTIAGVRVVCTSRAFIEKANLKNMADALEQRLKLVYLEDLRERMTPWQKVAGTLRAYYPLFHYQRRTRNRDPDQPAVILFTSGSEGLPKGVVLSHSSMLANYAQVRCYIDFQPQDLVFACLPLFHSFGLNAGCLMPLLGGSRIFLYPTPLHYRLIPELVYELRATILYGANTFFRGYARYAHPYDFNTLRYAVAGAEKLRDETMQQWLDKFGIRILQGYGVTETSPVISVNTPMANKAGTVGRLATMMECYLEPVEGIEQGGRLVVRGPNVMLGYLLPGRPGEISPPSASRGAGWYDTGDIASIDDEGFITIHGRAKRFAKIGGEMVSLTAVEELAALVWPKFIHAALNLPDVRKGEKIVLVTNCREADRRQLIDNARAYGYSELHIPRQIIYLAKIPVLGTGKTDYRKLDELITAMEKSGSEAEAVKSS